MQKMGAGIGKTMEKIKGEKENRDKKEKEEKEKHIYSKEKYIEECKRSESERDFECKLLGGIRFPEGTVSYIGARTGRGKTTSLVNIAREIMRANEKEEGSKRKIIIITMEMSCKQIMSKLILSSTYEIGKGNGKGISLLKGIENPAREADKIIQKKDIVEEEKKEGYKYFKKSMIEAVKKIFKVVDKRELIIYDGRGVKEEGIMNFIKEEGEAGTVVLIDYIQKIPAKEGMDKESYRRVQAISYDLLEAAVRTKAIIISAAQFARSGNKGIERDNFSEESFRECGDIEQDAHNAIGVGWEKNKKERFIEILKTREDGKQGEAYEIEFNGSYSYMAIGEEIEKEEKEEEEKEKEEKKYIIKCGDNWDI